MWEVVLLTGLLITAASLYLLVRTQQMLGLIDKIFATHWIYLAGLFRLLLGAALIASAHTVSFPQAITVIGWLFAASGLVLVSLPREAVRKMSRWFANMSPTLVRGWLLLGLLFGGFILYLALA